MMEPFSVFDCSLARCATGQSCSNLRELLVALRTVPENVLEHHMLRCPLEDHFELYEFPNDLARWCWDALGDHVVGEQLGLVDPYQFHSLAELRAKLIELLEDHLWNMDRVPWCRPGLELHLQSSRVVAYDTGQRIPTPVALAEAIPQMPLRSLFYHIHDARRRTNCRTDDFSMWLEQLEVDPALITRLRAIDFYFLNLQQLRNELIDVFGQYLLHSPPTG
jgi:hypothetical protein